MTAPATADPNLTPNPSSAGAPPTSTAEKTGAQDTGFRFTAGPGVKDWMVGKTPMEVAQMSDQLYQAAIQAPPPRTPSYQPSTGYQPPAPTAPLQPPTQEEWIQDPYAASQKQQAYANATQIAPAIQQAAGMIAQTNRNMARLQYADEFRRWGPEIDLKLNAVDPSYLTPQNIETVIQMVRGAHVNELAQEQVEREIEKRMAGGALMRPGTPGQVAPASTGVQVDFTKLPPTYQDWLRRNNVNEQTLEEFLQTTELRNRPNLTMNQAKTEWLEKAMKGDVLLETPPSKTGVGDDLKGGR